MTWRIEAACRALDPAMFVSRSGTVAPPQAIDACTGCSVRDACLTEALADPDAVGYLGGTTAKERIAMRVAAGATSARGRGATRKPIRHGTEGGAQAHRRRGEALCDPCRLAANEASARRKAAA